MVPHYNYYPPAGQIVDANEPQAQFNGRTWTLNGKAYSVPSGHRLTGRAGGPMAGWYYDWQVRAWMEPSPAPKPPATPPKPPATPPKQPATPPRPPATPPAKPQPTQPQPPAQTPEKKEHSMEKKPMTVLEDLMKHPVAPVIGGVLVVASYLTDAPIPPTIPADLPDPVAKQWQMVFAQNQALFDRRMAIYRDLGMAMLGYSGARSIVDVMGAMHEHRGLLPERK